MKLYKTQISEYTVLDKMVCDVCGKESISDNWDTKLYDVADTTVSYIFGKSYPDDHHEIELFLDICPECFQTKLVPFFESQGIKFNRREV